MNDDYKGDTPLATSPGIYDRAAMHNVAVRGFEENRITHQLITPEAAKAGAASDWLPVLNRYDVLSAEADHLVEIDRLALTGDPDQETRAGWVRTAKEQMLAAYGSERVGQALADARAFIAQDPQLRKLAARGFGDNPRLVAMATRLGYEARKAGRLK